MSYHLRTSRVPRLYIADHRACFWFCMQLKIHLSSQLSYEYNTETFAAAITYFYLATRLINHHHEDIPCSLPRFHLFG